MHPSFWCVDSNGWQPFDRLFTCLSAELPYVSPLGIFCMCTHRPSHTLKACPLGPSLLGHLWRHHEIQCSGINKCSISITCLEHQGRFMQRSGINKCSVSITCLGHQWRHEISLYFCFCLLACPSSLQLIVLPINWAGFPSAKLRTTHGSSNFGRPSPATCGSSSGLLWELLLKTARDVIYSFNLWVPIQSWPEPWVFLDMVMVYLTRTIGKRFLF